MRIRGLRIPISLPILYTLPRYSTVLNVVVKKHFCVFDIDVVSLRRVDVSVGTDIITCFPAECINTIKLDVVRKLKRFLLKLVDALNLDKGLSTRVRIKCTTVPPALYLYAVVSTKIVSLLLSLPLQSIKGYLSSFKTLEWSLFNAISNLIQSYRCVIINNSSVILHLEECYCIDDPFTITDIVYLGFHEQTRRDGLQEVLRKYINLISKAISLTLHDILLYKERSRDILDFATIMLNSYQEFYGSAHGFEVKVPRDYRILYVPDDEHYLVYGAEIRW